MVSRGTGGGGCVGPSYDGTSSSVHRAVGLGSGAYPSWNPWDMSLEFSDGFRTKKGDDRLTGWLADGGTADYTA